MVLAGGGLYWYMNYGGGGGGGGGGGDGGAPWSPKYTEKVCAFGKVWGTGNAKEMCCNANQDTTEPGNCTKPTTIDGVMFYKDSNWTGTAYGPIKKTTNFLNMDSTVGNDDLSSLRIPPGFKVELFKDTRNADGSGGGGSRTLTRTTWMADGTSG